MSDATVTDDHAVVDREEWIEARLRHMRAEKEFTRRRDELSEERRQLPWLEITEEYGFDGPDGEQTLSDLFDGRNQLIVYHFMYGPGWEEGCPSCSYWADNYDGIAVHLEHRDTTLVTISRAPLNELSAYQQRMGWNFKWLSSSGNNFNFDMAVSFTPEQVESGDPIYNFGTQSFPGDEAPGISVFTRTDDGRIFLTYQTFSRGLDMVNGAYHMLDLTAKGRDEDGLPWTMAWLHRHDAYPT
jgi:predicted dithiol-disulfide oxidoreductase (DUF899 family)